MIVKTSIKHFILICIFLYEIMPLILHVEGVKIWKESSILFSLPNAALSHTTFKVAVFQVMLRI